MDAAMVKALLEAHLEDCEFHVQGEGSHYDITAIGAVFDGLRLVKKQQLVYAALSDQIADQLSLDDLLDDAGSTATPPRRCRCQAVHKR